MLGDRRAVGREQRAASENKTRVAFTVNNISLDSSYVNTVFLQVSVAYGHVLQVIDRSLLTKCACFIYSSGK